MKIKYKEEIIGLLRCRKKEIDDSTHSRMSRAEEAIFQTFEITASFSSRLRYSREIFLTLVFRTVYQDLTHPWS